MKQFLLISALIILLIPKNANCQNAEKIIGEWQMVSMKFTYPNGKVMETNEFKYPAIRMYSKSYYSFGRQNDDGTLGAALGGKYSIKGNILTQERNYHVSSAYVGKSTDYEIEIKGDKLSLKGVTPNNITIEETYVKLE